MTYFGFLLIFVVSPILVFGGVYERDRRNGRFLPSRLQSWPPLAAIALHIVVALVYTTPWDNYLVATNVWWYDPELVTGFTIGWVPIEEYTFFVLQPILTGLWLLFWAKRIKNVASDGELKRPLRLWSVLFLLPIWLLMVGILVTGYKPGTYLALELAWAIPPIALQLGFGADILWRYRKLVAAVIIPTTLYLSAADALAIGWGTWTIDPEQSFHFLIGGILPIEEFVFFLITNVLITFGVTLILAQESHARLPHLVHRIIGSSEAVADNPIIR